MAEKGGGRESGGGLPAGATAAKAARKALDLLRSLLPSGGAAKRGKGAKRGDGPAPSGAMRPRRARLDLKSAFGSALRNPFVVATSLIVLALALATIVVAFIVGAPPARALAGARATTREGEDLVRSWLLPPGDPLEARFEFERARPPSYSAQDAARIALEGAPDMAELSKRNDEAIDELYRKVP